MLRQLHGFNIMCETPGAWGERRDPLACFAPVAAWVTSRGGSAMFFGNNGQEGIYVLQLMGRFLSIATREGFVSDLDRMFVHNDPTSARLRDDVIEFVESLMNRNGVRSLSQPESTEDWEFGLSPEKVQEWWLFAAARRGVDGPYPECDGLSIQEMIDIWNQKGKVGRGSMNMKRFLKICRESNSDVRERSENRPR